MSTLMIVESPSKAKTIGKYLYKDGIKVTASRGHVRELNKDEYKEKAIDVDNGFKAHYVLSPKNKENTNNLLRLAEKVDVVYLATDPDREGESISWHLMELIRRKNKNCQFKRVTYNEVNESAIRKAIANATELNMDMVHAQFVRSGIDFLFGFYASPILWKAIRSGLSAGRVQSPALRVLTEREKEIAAFVPTTYWSISLLAEKDNIQFPVRLSRIGNNKVDKQSITDKEFKDKHLAKLNDLVNSKERLVVKDISTSKVSRKPKAPYITSTMQMDAVRKLGWSSSRTMTAAQALFEGSSGEHGFITYHRTDSPVLSQEALSSVYQYGKTHYPKAIAESPKQYHSKSQAAQEAHECIRPTDISHTPESLKEVLKGDEYKLYEMIWQRTLASQMKPAIFDSTRITFDFSKDYSFRANGSVLVFKGFLGVYQEGDEIDGEKDDDVRLPVIHNQDKLSPVSPPGVVCEEKQTKPPARYNEASLVKVLEDYGIGRPSTYATIPKTLKDRGYITVDRNRITVTEMGISVSDFISSHFPEYVDYQYTSRLEEKMDDVSSGKMNWVVMLNQFWGPFKDLVDKISLELKGKSKAVETTEVCPNCGKHNLRERMGRRGPFLYCPNRSCGFTKSPGADNRNLPEYLEGFSCKKCGGRMVIIDTQYGKISKCEHNLGRNGDGSRRGTCDYFARADGSEIKEGPKIVFGNCWKCKESQIVCRLIKGQTPVIKCTNPKHFFRSNKSIPVSDVVERMKLDEGETLSRIKEFYKKEARDNSKKLDTSLIYPKPDNN